MNANQILATHYQSQKVDMLRRKQTVTPEPALRPSENEHYLSNSTKKVNDLEEMKKKGLFKKLNETSLNKRRKSATK